MDLQVSIGTMDAEQEDSNMEYFGILFVACISLIIGFVWGGIRWKRKIMDFISKEKDKSLTFCNQENKLHEEGDKDNLSWDLANWWNGYYWCTKTILEKFNPK